MGHMVGFAVSAASVIAWLFWRFFVQPGDLDRRSYVQRCFVQFLDDVFFAVIEDIISSNKGFYDGSTGRIGVQVDPVLSSLGIFAQTRPNMM
jgi:hypothetical protein